MAQTKFKLNSNEDHVVTHAHTQTKKVKKEPVEQKERGILSATSFSISSGLNLSVHLIKLFEILSPVQKQQLVEYATKNDKTASCVIKDALIEQGVIEVDS